MSKLSKYIIKDRNDKIRDKKLFELSKYYTKKIAECDERYRQEAQNRRKLFDEWDKKKRKIYGIK